MNYKYLFLLIGMFILSISMGFSQKILLKYFPIEDSLKENVSWRNEILVEDVEKTLQQQQIQQFNKGNLAFSIDTIIKSDSIYTLYYYQGTPFRFGKLQLDAIPKHILNAANISERDYTNQLLSPKKFNHIYQQLLTAMENVGYPFGKVIFEPQYDSLQPNVFTARVRIDQGELVKINSIKIVGNLELNINYLQAYLGIKVGDYYNHKQFKQIDKKLDELIFARRTQATQLNYSIAGNDLLLFLDERKANQVNFLMGIQPNTLNTSKFLWTVDALIGLKNAFGNGEIINATYQNLQANTPKLKIDGLIGYIAGTPIGVEGSFEFYRRDTAYRQTALNLGLRYQFAAKEYFKTYFTLRNNRIQSPDTSYVKTNNRLPDFLDIDNRGIGVQLYLDKTDYQYNPRKGWLLNVDASLSKRKIVENNAITELFNPSVGTTYKYLYDSANADPNQYKIQVNLQKYFPIGKQLALKLAYNGAALLPENNVYMNELFQIGGYKLFRGFDEESIYANQYHIGTAEVRILLDKNTYAYLFTDHGVITTRYNLINDHYYQYSFGGGVSLDSKSGIFNIALGLGKREDANLSFNQTKVHFGYIAYF